MVQVVYRWCGGLRDIETEVSKANEAGRVKFGLRDYLYGQNYKAFDTERFISAVGTLKEDQQQVLRLANRGIMLVWSRSGEEVGTGKYSHSNSVTPFLIGQATLFLDADHHSRMEDIWLMPEAANEYYYNRV